MKQVSNAENFLIPNSCLHHLICPPGSFSKYCLILLLAGITLLVSSCHKEDHNCKKTVPFKASFTTIDSITQAGTTDNPIQKDYLTGKGEGTPIWQSCD